MIAWAGLRAADTTNAPPQQAAGSDAVLASAPGDSAAEALSLRRIRDTFARRPAGDNGDATRDWLVMVVVRCEQFLGDQPGSSHVAEVRAVNAQCRQELYALNGDRAERDKAMQLARQSLGRNDRGPGAARARFVLARAAWPEDLGIVLEQTRLIIRDASDQPFAAEAFLLMARAQQRRGDARAVREAVIGLLGSFPKSPEAAQARMLLRQQDIVAQPAPLPAVTTADGKSLDLGDTRGRALVLDFWTAATQLAGENSGLLRRLFEVHHDSSLLVVGVNLDADRAAFDKANAAHPTPWPQVFASDPANAKLLEAYPALAAPSRLLVDPFGMVARVAMHPAEIEPLMKRWQTTGVFAASAARPTEAVKPAARVVAKAPPTIARRETPRPAIARVSEPPPKPKPVVEKKPVIASEKPTPPAPTRIIAAPVPRPPPPAPQPTHIEIGGVLYAKPLTPAAPPPVESAKPMVRVEPSVALATPPRPPMLVAKPFSDKPAKLGRAPATPAEPAEPVAVATKPPAPAAKSFASADKPAKLGRAPTTPAEPAESAVAKTKPPPPAPQPTHVEIGGVLYAKPLTPAAPPPVESAKPVVKVEPSVALATPPRPPMLVAKPFSDKPAKLSRATTTPAEPVEPVVAKIKPPAPAAKSVASAAKPVKPPPAAKRPTDNEKPAKVSRPAVAAAKKPEGEAKPSAPPKPRPGYGSAGAKAKLKTDSAESLATMPDITDADRQAALIDAAKRILKSEEELISWSELEMLFTTKKPASNEGSIVWYQDVADRCQQFIKDYPKSPRTNLVRINEARCRLILFQMKKDPSQRSRAETAAHDVLSHKPNEDDAIRAEFLLLNATWPDHPEQGVAVAKRIVKDFPHRRETAAAMLMHAQFRRRQTMLHAAKEAASDLLKRFPESEFAFNARALIKQCDLLNNPAPAVKLTGLRGEKMDTAAMEGKTVLIEFWSPKSKNALEDAAKLVQLYQRYHSKGFEIYTICVDKSREAMDIFQLSHPLPWPVYWDGQGYQGPVCEQFGVDTAPMRFLLEPGLHRVSSTHLSPEGAAAALSLWIDQNQPPLLPGQEPPAQGIFKKFFGLNL
jgi:peroxiredoxin